MKDKENQKKVKKKNQNKKKELKKEYQLGAVYERKVEEHSKEQEGKPNE